jgi:t-SNARE complex subunit (syntaxin)
MTSQYKENNFSAENLSVSLIADQDKISTTMKPNIDHLIKRILIERKRERKKIITFGVSLLIIVIFYVFLI